MDLNARSEDLVTRIPATLTKVAFERHHLEGDKAACCCSIKCGYHRVRNQEKNKNAHQVFGFLHGNVVLGSRDTLLVSLARSK